MQERKKKAWQIAAICVSFLVFIFLLFIDHIEGDVDFLDELNKEGKQIRQAFDAQLLPLVNQLPALTKTISPLKHCSKNTIEKLGEYAFTHPQLSTIAVKSSYLSRWCISPQFRTLIQAIPTHKNKRLLGPVVNHSTKETYFIIQYPGDGQTLYQLYVLKSVLQNAINIQNPLIHSVSLITKSGKTLLETKPTSHDYNMHTSLESTEQSKLLPNIFIHIDANETYIRNSNLKNIWSLRLLSIAVAGLFLLTLLMHIKRTFSMNGLIKQALRQDEFYPVFQPVIDATTHHIAGAEILIRWEDQYGAHIMPSQFIEEAENTGYIVPLTEQLIEKALQRFGDYLKANRAFHLGINLCRAHFIDTNWLQKLKALCQQFDIQPEQLMLEVTERTMIDITEINLVQRMEALHNAGFKLAIDDFGTSHASISYLRHFPLDYLKIDMMYIHAIGTGAVTEALLPPIILIANQLKLKIIAEGVETEAQLNYLKEHKVDYCQGWYFAKAMKGEEFLERLESEQAKM